MEQIPTTAYTEVQIDEDSISLTLLTESQDGPRVEDTERFTFEELQDMAGQHFTLSLSADSREGMAQSLQNALVAEMVGEEPDLPEPGIVLTDENAPSWSQDDGVVVTGVLENVTCDEYVIQGRHEGQALDPSLQSWEDETVANANPSYDSDQPVVLGRYLGGSREYAFPAERLQ